jgi:hypothetical protein
MLNQNLMCLANFILKYLPQSFCGLTIDKPLHTDIYIIMMHTLYIRDSEEDETRNHDDRPGRCWTLKQNEYIISWCEGLHRGVDCELW